MNITCTSCREQLNETFHNDADGGAASADLKADLQQHLAHCEACRQEWALLKSLRAELKAMPQIDAPQELRGRIARQLAQTPEVLSGEQIESTSGTVSSLSFLEKWREKLASFSRNPFAIARASGVALALFGLIILLRPYPETKVLLPEQPHPEASQVLSEESDQTGSENSGAETEEPTETAPADGAKTEVIEAEAETSTSTRTTPKAQNKKSQTAPQQAPSVSSKPRKRPVMPSPPNQSSAPAKAATPQRKTETLPPTQTSQKTQKPPAEEEAIKEPSASQMPASVTAERPSASEPQPVEIPVPESVLSAERKDTARRRDFAFSQKREPAGPKGPARPAELPPAFSIQNRADSMHQERYSPEPKPEQKQESEPVPTQKVRVRLRSPEGVEQAQVTAILPDTVRLKPSGKPLVLWRGGVREGEEITLDFEIEAVPGTYSIELILQEARNGELQKPLVSQTVMVKVLSGTAAENEKLQKQ